MINDSNSILLWNASHTICSWQFLTVMVHTVHDIPCTKINKTQSYYILTDCQLYCEIKAFKIRSKLLLEIPWTITMLTKKSGNFFPRFLTIFYSISKYTYYFMNIIFLNTWFSFTYTHTHLWHDLLVWNNSNFTFKQYVGISASRC